MYEVNGRQYLVSCSSNPNTGGRSRMAGTAPGQIKGYIAFALPEKFARWIGAPSAGQLWQILQAFSFAYSRCAFTVEPWALWHIPHCSRTAGS